jgi:hypothetical protein
MLSNILAGRQLRKDLCDNLGLEIYKTTMTKDRIIKNTFALFMGSAVVNLLHAFSDGKPTNQFSVSLFGKGSCGKRISIFKENSSLKKRQ